MILSLYPTYTALQVQTPYIHDIIVVSNTHCTSTPYIYDIIVVSNTHCTSTPYIHDIIVVSNTHCTSNPLHTWYYRCIQHTLHFKPPTYMILSLYPTHTALQTPTYMWIMEASIQCIRIIIKIIIVAVKCHAHPTYIWSMLTYCILMKRLLQQHALI